MRHLLRRVLHRLLRFLARLLFRLRVVGDTEHLRQQQLLIVANHESFIDGLLIGLFLPVDPVFVIHTSVTRFWYFRLFLSLVDYLAVDPNNPMAIKHVIRLIGEGRPVVIFPEGRITTTGNLMKVYEGPAFVACKTGAVIAPVRVEGAVHTLFARASGKTPRRWFARITLTVLPPTRLDVGAAATARQRRRLAGEAMRRLLQEMLFASRRRQTLYAALCDAVELYGRSRRLIEDIRQIEYSYQDFLRMLMMLARLVLRAAPEVGPGQRIGVLLPNMATTLALFMGLVAKGRTPAMLNFSAGRDGLQTACDASCINVIVTSRAFIDQARLGDKLAGLERVRFIHLEDLRDGVSLLDKLWLIAWAQWRPRAFEAPMQPQDAAVVLFTSGSEGKPKGVVLSHDAVLANIAQIRSVIDFSPDDKVLNVLPVFHSFGLTAGALLPLLGGADLFLYPSPLHYRVIPELAYDRACTILFGTSTFLANYGKHANPYDFYSLRYVVAGAEKLAEPVRDLWFDKFGLRIFEGYGATETAPVLAVNTPTAYCKGSVGQLLPGVEARLEPVPGIEEGGLLHVRGPNVMSGYLRVEQPGLLQPPHSSQGPGWYETGDIVLIDAGGFVHIIGRRKRFAKVAGEMISLENVEMIARAASPQAEHAASVQSDASRGEALVLFTTDETLDKAALQESARRLGQPEIAVPRKVVRIDALPLLGAGKVDHVALRRMAEEA